MKKKIMNVWDAVTLEENDERVTVGTWGRSNTSGKKSFLESMTSQERELLASPIRIVGTEDGEDFCFADYRSFAMEKTSDDHAEIVCSAESEQFIVNVAMKTEFDGFIDTSLTICPRGKNVKQVFGYEAIKPYTYTLSRLWLEIPLKRECAKYFQMFPRTPGMDILDTSGELTEEIKLPFKAQVFLSNDEVGFMVSFETRENFVPFESENCFEIIPKDDEVILRIRLFDEEPYAWREENKTNSSIRMRLRPITFHFGIMTTPVKPITTKILDEKAVHIDCYKKIAEDYEDFLGGEFEDTKEITFDRLKRLGVNMLYIHEKWNDLQNSPILTSRTSRRLKYIIDECHKRDIRVVPRTIG